MPVKIDTKIAGDKIALSTVNQADASTAAALNKLLVFDESSFIRQQRTAETNADDIKGEIEATEINVSALDAVGRLSMPKATPDGLAWAFQKMFGAPTTAAYGASGYKHLFKLLSYPDNPAYFTAAHRKGGASSGYAAADYQQHRGLALGSMELTVGRDAFLQMALGVFGIGYVDDMIRTEVKTGINFAAGPFEFTLDHDPQGNNKDVIFAVADDDGDGIYEVELTIESYTTGTKTVVFTDFTGIDTTGNVRVTYQVADDETGYTWAQQLTGLQAAPEFILKATNMRLYLNRGIDATGNPVVATGGQFAECELEQLTYTIDWAAETGRCWRVLDTTSSDYAQAIEQKAPTQRITLQRKVRDWLIKQNFDANSAFGIEINAIGPEMDVAGANYFAASIYFPYCKILNLEQEASDGKWRDTVEVAVLKKAGATTLPTVSVLIANKVASYAVA